MDRRSIVPMGNRSSEAAQFETTDPLADLQKLLPTVAIKADQHLPAFTGGLVGYAGYDTIRYYEGESCRRRRRMIAGCRS